MKAVHAEAVAATSIAYHEFLVGYRPGPNYVYAFVEGVDDPSFYRGHIEAALPDGWRAMTIYCRGKRQVIMAFESFDWSRFDLQQIGFFIDRDLSDFVPGVRAPPAPNVFVTRGYSIENYIATHSVFLRALNELCGVTNIRIEEWEKLQSIFESNMALFHDALAVVMAQVVIWRREKRNPMLQNFHPIELFDLSDGTLRLKDEFKAPPARVAVLAQAARVPVSDATTLAAAEAEYRKSVELGTLTRGKYLIECFVSCLKSVHSSISKFCAGHVDPPKEKIGFGPGNAVAILSPRVKCPADLQEFIASTYAAYAKRASAR